MKKILISELFQKTLFVFIFSIKVMIFSQTTVISTFAGSGNIGNEDGLANNASFNYPIGLTIDKFNNVYVTEFGSHNIRKITPEGFVSTLAGSGQQGFINGQGNTASFNAPSGIVADSNGNLFVADKENNVIRKILPDGSVSTFVGSGLLGNNDGEGVNSSFNTPYNIAVDKTDNLYVTDTFNNLIRKITPEGLVTTLAGSLGWGDNDGIGQLAKFYNPSGIAIDSFGNIFISDQRNNKIKKITPDGFVTTLAGNGIMGDTIGDCLNSSFSLPEGLLIDDSNNNLYVVDWYNQKIKKININLNTVSVFAGTGFLGNTDGPIENCSFNNPINIAKDNLNNIYITDYFNQKIRKINFNQNLSVENFNKKNELIIYPNPATETINISTLTPEKFLLKDFSGKTIKVIYLNKNNQKINISFLPNGLYFLTNEKDKSAKIIKD